jgi:hypothetical protein
MGCYVPCEFEKKDNMRDWLAGKLANPDPNGPVHHFSELSWPDGTLITVPDPEVQVHFMMGSTRAKPDIIDGHW